MDDNLKISKNKPNNFEFIMDTLWKNTLQITHREGLTTANRLDIYIILKSYINHNSTPVASAFFILEDGGGRRVLQSIPLYKLKIMDDFYEFLNWWDLIVKKIWKYEDAKSRISILLILNVNNVEKVFGQIDLKNPPAPTYPWKKTLTTKILKKNQTISKLKQLLSKSHNNRGGE